MKETITKHWKGIGGILILVLMLVAFAGMIYSVAINNALLMFSFFICCFAACLIIGISIDIEVD